MPFIIVPLYFCFPFDVILYELKAFEILSNYLDFSLKKKFIEDFKLYCPFSHVI